MQIFWDLVIFFTSQKTGWIGSGRRGTARGQRLDGGATGFRDGGVQIGAQEARGHGGGRMELRLRRGVVKVGAGRIRPRARRI